MAMECMGDDFGSGGPVQPMAAGEGMMFPEEDAADSDDADSDEAKPAGPTLTVIK